MILRLQSQTSLILGDHHDEADDDEGLDTLYFFAFLIFDSAMHLDALSMRGRVRSKYQPYVRANEAQR